MDEILTVFDCHSMDCNDIRSGIEIQHAMAVGRYDATWIYLNTVAWRSTQALVRDE